MNGRCANCGKWDSYLSVFKTCAGCFIKLLPSSPSTSSVSEEQE